LKLTLFYLQQRNPLRVILVIDAAISQPYAYRRCHRAVRVSLPPCALHVLSLRPVLT
jgi:hypothetical protein